MNGDLLQEQKRIEEEATLTGVRRATKALAKSRDKEREATSAVGVAMVKRITGPMEELLRADLEKRGRGRVTSGGPLIRDLRDIDPAILCLTATRAALQRMSRPTKLIALARRIGEDLEDELRWHRWENLNKAQADAVRRRVNQSPSAHQRHAALAGFAKRWEKRVMEGKWSSHMLIGLGTRFIDYLVRLEVFEMTKIQTRVIGKKRKAAHAVQLTPRAAEWAREMGEFLAVSRPLSWPLVVPPVPWTSPYGGGFHFRQGQDHPAIPKPLRPLPLVRRACKEQREMLAQADLSVVYAGLNAAQATAWRINPRTYAVLARLIEEGREVPGITSLEQRVEPERLSDEEAKDKAKLRARNNEARKVKKANAQMFSKRFAEHRVFSTARKFVTFKEIYFAYNLDFRGRVYACSDDLSPQGNDVQRGLLEFAHGDPLTQDGATWLAVHVANCWGFDKASFGDRERWTADNEEMILRIAEDPIANTEWHKADKKSVWQFLAACFAWADFRKHHYQTVCRVPVMLDGSCSGIQHYAALLRDADAGAAVNLVPRDWPGDLYGDVAHEVIQLTRRSREPYALEWYNWKPDRKIVKRSVMTLPYGSTFISNLDYTREAARERYQKEGTPRWLTEEDDKDAHVALAKFTWKAMHNVVKGPIAGMSYVKRMVKSWASYCPHRKFYWTAPCGFPVVTNYLERKVKKDVIANVGDIKVTLTHSDEIEVTNWSRVEMAAPPNFVHSLDASHLLLSLKRASEEGITQLAAVHDAFGTTPTRTARFAQILREEFAKMYASDPFECLRASLRTWGVTLPEEPAMGTLDPAQIAHAEYLFA